jgi:membrane-associated phospholipid phosphatase
MRIALRSGLFVLILCIVSIVFVDRPLAEALKQIVHGPLESFFKAVTNLGRAELYMVPAALIGLWAWTHGKDTIKRQALYVFVTLTASGAVELSVKYLLGRTRPKLWLENQEFTLHPLTHGWAVNSFPSGHFQASWAAMTALAVLFPRYSKVFFGLAIIVALSRVMLTVHWLSDAMAGAWVGFASALILREIILKPPATES